jgi:hypothetical protein
VNFHPYESKSALEEGCGPHFHPYAWKFTRPGRGQRTTTSLAGAEQDREDEQVVAVDETGCGERDRRDVEGMDRGRTCAGAAPR